MLSEDVMHLGTAFSGKKPTKILHGHEKMTTTRLIIGIRRVRTPANQRETPTSAKSSHNPEKRGTRNPPYQEVSGTLLKLWAN